MQIKYKDSMRYPNDNKLVSDVYATVHKYSIDTCDVEYPLLRIERRTPLGSQIVERLQTAAIDCTPKGMIFPYICCFAVSGKNVPDEQKLVVMCNFAYITIGVGLKRNVKDKQIDSKTYHLHMRGNGYSSTIGVNTNATVKFFTANDAKCADLSCLEFNYTSDSDNINVYPANNSDPIINRMIRTMRNLCDNPEDMNDWLYGYCFAVYTGNDSANLRLMVSVGRDKVYLGVGM